MSDRFTISVIVGTRTDAHSFRSQVGMGSESDCLMQRDEIVDNRFSRGLDSLATRKHKMKRNVWMSVDGHFFVRTKEAVLYARETSLQFA